MTVQVCETVTGTTTAELRTARDRATAGDLVELRLDGVADVDVRGALDGRRGPVIVTCRPTWEGGAFDGPEAERRRLLAEAARLGADYVDVEWRTWQRGAVDVPADRLVLSHHDFTGVPQDLADRLAAMRSIGAAVTKIAVMANRLGDVVRLRSAMGRPGTGRDVVIAMGSAGLVTRLHPAAFGSCWTYAGDAAPGQVSARQLLDVYRVRQTTTQTALFGVTGRPLAHSASPAMHNAAFAALGLDAVYVPFETSDAGEVLEIARALGVKGLSVTAPLKGPLRQAADRVDDIAKATGAVNTLGFGRDGLEGRNFDVDGFLEPLRRRDTALDGVHAVVLGAGGAARSAVFALKREGADVAVAARRHDEAVALARDLGVGVAPWPPPTGWDLLVNATPVGTWPAVQASPLPDEALRGGLVYDLVYNPRQTALITHARREGIEGIGGLEMLVAQAQRQCEWWTGHRPDGEAMTRAAIASMQAHQVT